jgi:uncharacterized protein YndB with AHSA1/START domain
MPGIYVQRQIQGSIDEVWRLTQTPQAHQRWTCGSQRFATYPGSKGSRGGSYTRRD